MKICKLYVPWFFQDMLCAVSMLQWSGRPCKQEGDGRPSIVHRSQISETVNRKLLN